MAGWILLDYIEVTGRCPIGQWLKGLPDEARARVDYRLQQMAGMTRWPEKWVSKYRGTEEIIELRITYDKVQYRPLGAYFGARQFILLCGSIEKGGKLPKNDVAAAITRLANARGNTKHVQVHQFDDGDDLAKDGQEGVS